MPVSIQMNDRQLREFIRSLTVLPRVRQRKLLGQVGLMAQRETRRKLISGSFQGPSRWTRAKKGVNKSMVGVADKVFWQRKTDNMGIVETVDPRFSLYQHVRGFTKPAGSGGVQDRVFGDWVVLPLKQPGALWATAPSPFIYNWKRNKRPSIVPGRSILPRERTLALGAELIATQWTKKLVKEAIGRAGI